MLPSLDKVMELGRELLEQIAALRADLRELTAELRHARDRA